MSDMTLRDAQLEKARRELARRRRDAETKPRSFGQGLRENLLGDDDPTTQNFGERVGSALNKAGEAMTFGLIGDEASAAVESAVPGVSYNDRLKHYRQQEEVLERDTPGVALGSELGGAVLGAVAAPMAALPRAGMVGRAVGSAAMGAAGGGAYGYMEGEGAQGRQQQALDGAKVGAVVGAAAPGVGAGVQKVANALRRGPAIRAAAKGAPSTAELRRMGQQAYKQVDEAGVQVKPEAFNRMIGATTEEAAAQGLDQLPGAGSLTPQSARVLEIGRQMAGEMGEDPTAALPFSSLDQLRRHAGTAAGNMTNKTDSRVGTSIVGGIDDFVEGLGPDDLVAGDAEALKGAIGKARDTWSRMSRSQTIDDAIEASDMYLSGGASGIRNQFKRILKSPKLSRGFSDAEKTMMKRVVHGTLPETMLHYLGSGLGMLGTMGAGGAAGSSLGPLGAVGGAALGAAVAGGTRKASEAVASRNAEIVRAIVANGGMPQLPTASPAIRKITESLMRRTGAAAQTR